MTTLSRVGEIVRRADPDRFLTTLFAPPERRETLWALYAFNHELVRAHEAVREPMMAMIRLQWWREVVEGAARRHEIAEPVGAALAEGALDRDDLLRLIAAREEEAPEGEAAWREHVCATAGALAVIAGKTLGVAACPGLEAAGAAYGAAGILRNRALAGEAAVPGLREAGLEWLDTARRARIPAAARSAALCACLARRDLAGRPAARERGLGDKMAVLRGALTGRL